MYLRYEGETLVTTDGSAKKIGFAEWNQVVTYASEMMRKLVQENNLPSNATLEIKFTLPREEKRQLS